MENGPVVIRPPNRLPTPLLYDDYIDTTNMANIMLIDSNVLNNKEFYDSANANTFPPEVFPTIEPTIPICKAI